MPAFGARACASEKVVVEILGAAVSEPTALYRYFDCYGDLLYVGISLSAVTRLSQHKKHLWFQDITDIKVEWFAEREDAESAEVRAIRNEFPEHNVTHRVKFPPWAIFQETTGKVDGWYFARRVMGCGPEDSLAYWSHEYPDERHRIIGLNEKWRCTGGILRATWACAA